MSTEQRAGELYFVEAYNRTMMGMVIPGKRERARNLEGAHALAERFARQTVGAIIYRQSRPNDEPFFVGAVGDIPKAIIAAVDRGSNA